MGNIIDELKQWVNTFFIRIDTGDWSVNGGACFMYQMKSYFLM